MDCTQPHISTAYPGFHCLMIWGESCLKAAYIHLPGLSCFNGGSRWTQMEV